MAPPANPATTSNANADQDMCLICLRPYNQTVHTRLATQCAYIFARIATLCAYISGLLHLNKWKYKYTCAICKSPKEEPDFRSGAPPNFRYAAWTGLGAYCSDHPRLEELAEHLWSQLLNVKDQDVIYDVEIERCIHLALVNFRLDRRRPCTFYEDFYIYSEHMPRVIAVAKMMIHDMCNNPGQELKTKDERRDQHWAPRLSNAIAGPPSPFWRTMGGIFEESLLSH